MTTHSFNTTQRLVDLPIVIQGGGIVQIQITGEPNLAPPGWYMLFLTDHNRVPSVARWVHLAAAPSNAIPAGAYTQAMLGTRGLVAYWPLAEISGTVAYDMVEATTAAARPPPFRPGPTRPPRSPSTG